MKEDVLSKDPTEVATFERVALEDWQVSRYDLTTYPPKGTDSRAKEWIKRGRRTCQLEALPPDDLAMMLRARIESYLDLDILEEDRQAEQQERRQITLALPAAE